MPLTATTSPQGLQLLRYTTDNEVMHTPGDPGDTFTRGDQVLSVVGEGLLDPVGANEGGMVGSVLKTIACTANTQAFPSPADYDSAEESAAQKCLIPIKPLVPSGVPIYQATFANHVDDTVVSWTASTRTIVGTTGHAGNDYPNGALVYVYDGPGAGEVNVVEDYVHSSKSLVLHRPFSATLTTSSKYIVVSGEAVASRGVGFFNRMEAGSASALTSNQGSDDGDFIVYCDWKDTAKFLKNLTLPVIPIRYFMLS